MPGIAHTLCRSMDCMFKFQLGLMTFMEIDCEMFPMIILLLPIKKGSCQLLATVCRGLSARL